MKHDGVEKAVATSLAMLMCAVGRGADFATTWVAVDKGTAVEAKPLAADLFRLLGHHTGMIAYEAFITTPVIFLGCYAVERIFRHWDAAGANAGRLLLFVIGVVSLSVAMHNVRFLL